MAAVVQLDHYERFDAVQLGLSMRVGGLILIALEDLRLSQIPWC